jgi:signal transduction histidine kinase
MEIKDNGVGFNVAEKQQSTTSYKGVGLKSLFNRAQLIGAQIAIDSNPGSGTKTTIRLPLNTE